jgi:beta-lactamase class A
MRTKTFNKSSVSLSTVIISLWVITFGALGILIYGLFKPVSTVDQTSVVSTVSESKESTSSFSQKNQSVFAQSLQANPDFLSANELKKDQVQAGTLDLRTITSQYEGEFAVVVSEIGTDRSFYYNENDTYVTASVYKLLQSYSILKRIDSGELSWNLPVLENDTLGSCFDSMIRYSNNECGVALQDLVSNPVINSELRELGLRHTDLNNVDEFGNAVSDKITTAKDIDIYLRSIVAGTTLTPQRIGELLPIMSEQEFRDGIPTGVVPLPVANKVGWLDEYINDVGYVYGKEKIYTVTILSKNSTWESIAGISKEIMQRLGEL